MSNDHEIKQPPESHISVRKSTHTAVPTEMRLLALTTRSGTKTGADSRSTQRNVISESEHVPRLFIKGCPVRKSTGKDRGDVLQRQQQSRGPCKMKSIS